MYVRKHVVISKIFLLLQHVDDHSIVTADQTVIKKGWFDFLSLLNGSLFNCLLDFCAKEEQARLRLYYGTWLPNFGGVFAISNIVFI